MQPMLSNPAFVAYATACLVLCANLLFLWGFSGVVRGKTKTVLNSEDSDLVAKGAKVVESEPPEVARVLRAHRNAEASIYPFFCMGLIYVLLGGSAIHAKILFSGFVFARIVHSIAYMAGKQPWRTISFVLGALLLLAMGVDIAQMLAKGV